MTMRLLRFEVYRSNYPSSALGERFDDIDATDHRAAKQLAARAHPGIAVVVLPARPPVTSRDRMTHTDPQLELRSPRPRP